jgi:phosphoribosyl-dephospho-CoA transferase
MSIESHLVSLRTYLEGISNQQAQILTELKRINVNVPGAAKPNAFIDAVTQDVLSKPKAAAKPQTAAAVEKQLEAETGKDFVRTSSDPVTLAETDKPAPKTASK